jgi:pimeloyl-ACP methyl ester carboxylesterase
VSTPATLRLPAGYRRVRLTGRHGRLAAVQATADDPQGEVLLLPGLTGSKEDYFAILGPLLGLGWSVTAIDLPGQYESDGAADPAGYTLSDLAADINGAAEQVATNGRLHLVGHSVGGLLAREALLAEPDRYASLVLYASGQARVGERASTVLSAMDQLLAAVDAGQVYEAKRAGDRAAGRPDPPPEIDAFMRERFVRTGSVHLRGLGQIGRTAPDRVPALAELRRSSGLPVLVLWGSEDDETWAPQDYAGLAHRLACEQVVVPGAAHSPAVEDPAAMVAALDRFWRAAATGRRGTAGAAPR